ncbi:hypothetical protein Tco_0744181 [Tanacetum coccineum]
MQIHSHLLLLLNSKEIAKPIIPPSESASEEDEDNDPKQAQRDKDMHKNLALIAKYIKNIYKPTNNNLRTSSNTRNKNVATSPRTGNNNQIGQFGNQRIVTVAEARQHSEQPESINDTYVVEMVDSNVIPNSSDMCDNEKKAYQNAEEYEDERVVLAI